MDPAVGGSYHPNRDGRRHGDRIEQAGGRRCSRHPRVHPSMKPLLIAIVTACVRSFAPSFDRMFLKCDLTVASETPICDAIILLEPPIATLRRTSISRWDRVSSATCSASSAATSFGIRRLPAYTARIEIGR